MAKQKLPREYKEAVQFRSVEYFKHKSVQVPAHPAQPVKLEIDSERTTILIQNPSDGAGPIYLGEIDVVPTYGEERRGYELLGDRDYFHDITAHGEIYAIAPTGGETWITLLEGR